MDRLSETAEELSTFASDMVATIKERPYTTLAIAGGLAFAIGALWMVRRQQQQSSLDALLSRLPELPVRQSSWPRLWR
jgi:hypothetical protein